ALNITGDAACAVIIDAIAEEEAQGEFKQQKA
ncbi:sodium:dicarboxylate symporter, partial [Vibrio parahaemolyticus]|nr:sodium:dicarboxylate symporter [Vibrio parahaemolyticus]